MKTISVLAVLLMLVCGLTASTQAELIDRGGGLIYDTELDITWMQDATYGWDGDFDFWIWRKTWDDAMAWADSLVYQGYDDWRLPHYDISCGYASADCATSEMGHLLFVEGIGPALSEEGPFINVQGGWYWTGTEYPSDTSKAWDIDFNDGIQYAESKNAVRYVWAVRDGDSAPPVIPEPVSSILFVIGGATLAVRNYRRKRLGQR